MTERRGIPTVFHWSGGKDSAQALGLLLGDERYDVQGLLTTVQEQRGLSSVHGIPTELLSAHAEAIGLPLHIVGLAGDGLEGYLERMDAAAESLAAQGVRAFAFGDLEVSDMRKYKDEQFGRFGIEVVEPLWGPSPVEVVEGALAMGIEAVTCVVDASVLDASFCGVRLDRAFLDRLPAGVDPCGELGEYHTFVTNAPYFRAPVPVDIGEPWPLRREIRTTEGERVYDYWVCSLSAPGEVAGPDVRRERRESSTSSPQ